MPGRLTGRVGVVTGAGRPVGRSVARALAAEGMSLALIGYPAAEVRATAELVEARRVSALPAAADLADRGAVDRIVPQVEQRLGPIDLLVLVPEVGQASVGPLWRELPTVEATVAAELRRALLIAAAVLPTMVARTCGQVVYVVPAVEGPAAVTTGVTAAALRALAGQLAESLAGTGVRAAVVDAADDPERAASLVVDLVVDLAADLTARRTIPEA